VGNEFNPFQNKFKHTITGGRQMNANRLNYIRKEEKKYHEQYYADHELYQKDSWLEVPDDIVMELFSHLNLKEPLQVLDLGCGVGRNSIPMAQQVKAGGGRVTCVDLLQNALDQLEEYSKQYDVDAVITVEQSDIGDYDFKETAYDYIVAATSLEHVKSKTILEKVLAAIADKTNNGGVNFISINTNIEEVNLASGTNRPPLFEVMVSKGQALRMLRENYKGWEELHVSSHPLELEINRDDVPVLLKADNLTFAIRKPG
jgi:2-polyprenyl-3-methyl-5-hydroxy-6-metoxy-1,4-benzoquinol methylase